MTDHYPYPDGDFTVLGPGIVASSDGKTISWRGENYVRHDEARTALDNPATSTNPPDNPLRERIAEAARTVRLCLGPNAVALAVRGEPIILNMGEADQLADAALAALRPELDRLAALRQVARDYCFTCGRGDAAPTVADWETQYDRADTAEQRLGKVRDLRDDLRGVTGARWIADALDSILDQPMEQP